MPLHVQQVAIQVVAELRPLMPRIARHDKNLAAQVRRSASSVVLNIAEGEYSDPGTRRSRYHSAAGSASETDAALRVAMAWRYVSGREVERVVATLDRVLAMLWKLTH